MRALYFHALMRLSACVFLTIALVSSGVAVIVAQSRTPATTPSDASPVSEPCSVSALEYRHPNASSGNGDALGTLALQRAKWRAQQPASYRLCVVTLNPMVVTITETDVVNGVICDAHEATGFGALRSKERLEAGDWSRSSGLSVERLFDELQRAFREMRAPTRPGLRLVSTATYDPTLGYPVHTYTAPAPGVQWFDADVETLIRLTPLPASR